MSEADFIHQVVSDASHRGNTLVMNKNPDLRSLSSYSIIGCRMKTIYYENNMTDKAVQITTTISGRQGMDEFPGFEEDQNVTVLQPGETFGVASRLHPCAANMCLRKKCLIMEPDEDPEGSGSEDDESAIPMADMIRSQGKAEVMKHE